MFFSETWASLLGFFVCFLNDTDDYNNIIYTFVCLSVCDFLSFEKQKSISNKKIIYVSCLLFVFWTRGMMTYAILCVFVLHMYKASVYI